MIQPLNPLSHALVVVRDALREAPLDELALDILEVILLDSGLVEGRIEHKVLFILIEEFVRSLNLTTRKRNTLRDDVLQLQFVQGLHVSILCSIGNLCHLYGEGFQV